MAESTSQRVTVSWRVVFERARTAIWPPEVPDHAPAPILTPHEDWLRRLDRIRDLLEQTRASLVHRGWAQGSWFSVDAGGGIVRAASTQESFGLLAPGAQVAGACLIGSMLRLVEDPDTAGSFGDAWACVDELHEALHERLGHDSLPVGRVYSHEQRRGHLRTLTTWNDEPGRRLEDVLDVIDRAVSRTVVGACRI